MEYRNYGSTDIQISALGLGAAEIGSLDLSDAQALQVLEQALNHGITLFDTARSYGASEDRIKDFVRGKRDRIVLSTKVGYGVSRVPDWTHPSVIEGIDEALMRMRCDYLDIVHLHSCSREILERGEVIEALQKAKQAGKIRAMAYSGENDALEWAIQNAYFDGVQCSINLCDQKSLNHYLPQAKDLGIIAKRPMANAFWQFDSCPTGQYAETYWQRWQALEIESPIPMDHLALRFAVFSPQVSSAIVGTANPERIAHNVRILQDGPLPDDWRAAISTRFAELGTEWEGRT